MRCPRILMLRWTSAIVTAILPVVLMVLSTTLQADEFSPESPLSRRLLAPMTSVIDGKPFRDALEQVAGGAQVNLCVDRRVDPTSPVSPGVLGPDVYSSIKQIAGQHDCVVMPVATVVLVGRAEWVDATATSLMMLTQSGDAQAATVSWPTLTTPAEALRHAAGNASVDITLPHDLWPATSWRGVDRRVATALVLAQFDLRLGEETSGDQTLTSVPVEPIQRCRRRYQPGKHGVVLRQTIEQADGGNALRPAKQSIDVLATATAHRLATDALMTAFALPKAPPPNEDKRQFSLELKAPAGDAIRKFAATANLVCVIDETAQTACRSIITLSAKDKTLRELIELVAEQADLTATWRDNQVVISKR